MRDSDRVLPLTDLPEPVIELVHAAGQVPREDAGATVTAGHNPIYQVLRTSQGYRLTEQWVVPLRDPDVLLEAVAVADVCRVLISVLGDGFAWQAWAPGQPLYGLPRDISVAERLHRLRGVSLRRLTAAYLGEGEGVLDRLREPAAIDLLGAGIRQFVRTSPTWDLHPGGGPEGALITQGLELTVQLRRTKTGYAVLWRGERANDYTLALTTTSLTEANETAPALMRGTRPAPYGREIPSALLNDVL